MATSFSLSTFHNNLFCYSMIFIVWGCHEILGFCSMKILFAISLFLKWERSSSHITFDTARIYFSDFIALNSVTSSRSSVNKICIHIRAFNYVTFDMGSVLLWFQVSGQIISLKSRVIFCWRWNLKLSL